MKSTEFNFDQFKFEGEHFLTTLVSDLRFSGVPVEQYLCDHLCFRVQTQAEYDSYKASLLSESTLLTETQVNGRPICTFRLHSPFKTQSHVVELLELPAPKLGTIYYTGFEHAEFVVKECFDSFSSRYPHLRFTRAGCQTVNPELSLCFGERQAKFHHLSLERVIEIEQAQISDIIFDLDGTLVRSRENIYEINRRVFTETLGREITLEESVEKYHPEFYKLFEAFEVECPVKQKRALSIWGEVSERFRYEVFDGAIELLRQLRSVGFKLHLWTARDERSARTILKDHGIESIFETLSFATEVDSKPHEKSLRFEWQSIPKNRVLVIGDSPSDIYGSKNIGAVGAGALWDPFVRRSSLIGAGAELFFHDPRELGAWLKTKSGGIA